ncbi:hypothetical protein Tco_0183304 [Tanacetum coccineum]
MNPTETGGGNPSGGAAATAESCEDRSLHISPYDSVNHSVHTDTNVHCGEGTDSLRIESLVDHPTDVRLTFATRSPQRGDVNEGESSRHAAYYMPEWFINRRCRLNTPMWCRELMVHLAPLAAQEDSNALNNATTLERAWFALRRGALAQTDMLERFKNLQADYDKLAETHADCENTVRQLIDDREASQQNSRLYLEMSERFKKVKNDHAGCAEKIQLLEDRNSELSRANKDQTLRIKELEDTLAKKDSALVYAERISSERAQEKEKLVAQLSKTEMEKFDSIRKLLPTVVEHLFQSHEYKQSLSEPFNLAIQAGWGKGLTEEGSEEDLLELMGRMENFDAYADKKMYVEFDKLFEKQYPYVEKISRDFCHTVSDLLKVYPDSPPSG